MLLDVKAIHISRLSTRTAVQPGSGGVTLLPGTLRDTHAITEQSLEHELADVRPKLFVIHGSRLSATERRRIDRGR